MIPSYIDANLLKAEFTGNFAKAYAVSLIKSIIDQQPIADVQEVKHAKWLYRCYHKMMGHEFECSACRRWICANSVDHVVEEYPYCHCGAKIDGVEGLEED